MRVAPTGKVYARFAEFTAGNAAFHAVIARAARNRFLSDAIHHLHSYHRLAALYLHHGILDAAPALEEHALTVEGIAERDPQRSSDLMRAPHRALPPRARTPHQWRLTRKERPLFNH
jgi:DNA-binding GntR family transcriptional regulator